MCYAGTLHHSTPYQTGPETRNSLLQNDRKSGQMHCEKLIDEPLSVQGNGDRAQQTCSEETHETICDVQCKRCAGQGRAISARIHTIASKIPQKAHCIGGSWPSQTVWRLVLYDRAFIVIQIDALDNIDIQKLYVCYQERLCVATKMRGYAVLQLYVRGFIYASPNYSLKPARVYY